MIPRIALKNNLTKCNSSMRENNKIQGQEKGGAGQ